MAQNSVFAAKAAVITTPMTGSQFMLCPCNRVFIYCPGCGYKLGSKFRVCDCSRVCNYCWNCGYNLLDFQLRPHKPSIETDAPFDASRVLYFYSSGGGLNEWYRVDLERLPEKLSPIAELPSKRGIRVGVGGGLGFTFIGDDLYCNGGLLLDSSKRPISKKLFKYTPGKPKSEWKTVAVCDSHLGYGPLMFSFDNKIYVMRGNRNPGVEEPVSQDYWGRVFNVKSNDWEDVKPITNFDRSVHSVPALKGESTVVLFTLDTGTLFLYNAIENTWSSTPHPSLVLEGEHVPSGLEDCDSLRLLGKHLIDRAPLVRDLTLYWFCTDLRLYGYDSVQKRWLVSNSIEKKLLTLGRDCLPLPVNPDYVSNIPMLVDLCHEKFLLLVRLVATNKLNYAPFLAMATLAVDKKACALNVSLEKCHLLPVDRPFKLSSGMSMLKTTRSSMLE